MRCPSSLSYICPGSERQARPFLVRAIAAAGLSEDQRWWAWLIYWTSGIPAALCYVDAVIRARRCDHEEGTQAPAAPDARH